MNSSITLPKNFNINSISFGTVKTQESGGKSVYVSYNGSPLLLQTPKCNAPFGISKWSDDKVSASGKSNDKYSLELSFNGFDKEDSHIKKFYDVITSIDDLVKKQALDNSLTWFNKKKMSEDLVNDSYSSPLKFHMENGEPSTSKYAPRIRLSIPMDRDGKFSCQAYIDKKLVALTPEITKNVNITAIIRATGLWVISSRYGTTYKVEQLMIEPRMDHLEKFAFLDTDETTVIEADAVVAADVAVEHLASDEIDSSDDESPSHM